ncbi:MAG: hypothetical protein ACI8ZM_001256 [Crocinitomix sp.]|jgi:hypothetical protein
MRLTFLLIFLSSYGFSQNNVSFGYTPVFDQKIESISADGNQVSGEWLTYKLSLINQFHISFSNEKDRIYYTAGLNLSFKRNNEIDYSREYSSGGGSSPYNYTGYFNSESYSFRYTGLRLAMGLVHGENAWSLRVGTLLRAEILTHHNTSNSVASSKDIYWNSTNETGPTAADFPRAYLRSQLLRFGLEAKPRYKLNNVPLFIELQTTIGAHLISSAEAFSYRTGDPLKNKLFYEVGFSVGYLFN